MKDDTKTLEQIVREVERARDRAERMEEEWYEKYRDMLSWFETRRRVSLLDKYASNRIGLYTCVGTDISRRLEKDGIDVYEEDDDAPHGRVKCTARAIKKLRAIEQKIDEWHAKYIMAEDALDALY